MAIRAIWLKGTQLVGGSIIWLFDAISIQFLDRLPNVITVGSIMVLFIAAELLVGILVQQSSLVDGGTGLIMFLSVLSGLIAVPIAGFGQIQYRRARRSVLDLQHLAEELTVARDQAQAANRQKSQFLASMSHELRTPLNAIIGFSDIIKREIMGGIENRRYIEYASDIHRSGSHLLSLINDLLDLAKIESSQNPAREGVELRLSSIAQEVTSMMRLIATNCEVQLSLEYDMDFKIRVDDRMLRQVLLNLISNAVKFTPQGGKVTVSLSAKHFEPWIVVSDTGVGMTAAEQEIALSPFGQIDSFQARKHKGTGLGLPLVKAMVEALGGALRIESTPSVGTTVSFLFA